MYANKLAVALKINNRILREVKDTVYVPFGSEYSILLKNLNTKRSILNIFVDGTNVVPGGLVLNAGQEINLERSIVNGNLNKGNKFKFIERTGQIEAHRGVKLEDGLIRVEFQYEQTYQAPVYYPTIFRDPVWDDPFRPTWTSTGGGSLRGVTLNSVNAVGSNSIAKGMADVSISASSASIASADAGTVMSYNDAGITVPGSLSEQKFSTVSSFALETEKHSMILRLLGETPDNKPVTKPVTVKQRTKCNTCGTQNKAHAKFCSKCGSSLVLFA